MIPRKLFCALRERAIVAGLLMMLCAAIPLGFPGLRSRLIPAVGSMVTLRAVGDDVLAEDDDPTNKTDSDKKENGFKKVITAPVRLFARMFGGKDEKKKKQEMLVTKPTAKDLERFAAVPVSGEKVEKPATATTTVAEAPIATNETASERAASTWLDQAIELQERGRVDAAIEKLNAALSLRPNYAEARNLLAVCYDGKTQYRQAQEEYKKALKLEPSNARFLNNIGYSYYLSGEYKDAIKWYQKALKITPDDRRLHNNLGLAYGQKGEYNRAFEHFSQAVGETGAHLNLGYVYNQQGRHEEAIKHYEIVLRVQPKSLQALSHLAQLYERVGRLREAAALNEQYKKLQQTVDHK